MDVILPRIFKTRYAQGAVLEIDPAVHSYNAGHYIQKGTVKSIVYDQNNLPIEVDFPEKTLVLDDGYKLYPSDELIKWENVFGDCELWRYNILNKPSKLIAQEHGTTTICLFHTVNLDDDLITILHDKHKFSKKVDLTNSVWAYSVRCIKEEDQIELPEGHFLCLAYGKALVNGELKNKKTWIRSTKDQVIDVVNQHDESIFFLSKIK